MLFILFSLFSGITAHAQIKTFGELISLRDLTFGKFREVVEKAGFVNVEDGKIPPGAKSGVFMVPGIDPLDVIGYHLIKDHGTLIRYVTSRIYMIKDVRLNLVMAGYTLHDESDGTQTYTKGKLFFMVSKLESLHQMWYQMGEDIEAMRDSKFAE